LQTKLQKFCSQTSLSFDALQPRPVKNPAVAFSHGQDPEPTLHSCAGCAAALPERAARFNVKLAKLKEEMGQARSLRETDACRTRFEMQGEV
jgi:hypothetical protein